MTSTSISETAKIKKRREKGGNSKEETTKQSEKRIQSRYTDFAASLVTISNIRKEINDREAKLAKVLPEKYNHLTGEYFGKILEEECAKAGIPVDTFMRKKQENCMKKCPIALQSSPMPETSSGIIGWRASRREHNLEFVGPFHISNRHTIEPPCGPDEFRVTNQKFILLG